ncbi:MAG: response regulator [Elusimicrobia bacterium]|nr:response regulator [Elusimicrobiota bacterium]
MSDKKKVLIVDDDSNFSTMLKCALEDDFSVITAFDGREGVEKAVTEVPSLIVMDVMMPNISGLEMLRMLLAEEATRGIPVLVATGSNYASLESIFKQEINVREVISKTTPITEILAIVKNILGA